MTTSSERKRVDAFIREHVWPPLKAAGFERVTARSWCVPESPIARVVDVQSFGRSFGMAPEFTINWAFSIPAVVPLLGYKPLPEALPTFARGETHVCSGRLWCFWDPRPRNSGICLDESGNAVPMYEHLAKFEPSTPWMRQFSGALGRMIEFLNRDWSVCLLVDYMSDTDVLRECREQNFQLPDGWTKDRLLASLRTLQTSADGVVHASRERNSGGQLMSNESAYPDGLGDLDEILSSISVEAQEDDEQELLAAGSDPEWAKSRYSVSFGDVAAHEFYDLVEETVDLAKRFPGVTDALHEDRELIVLLGDFDPAALERHVRAWWKSQLRRVL